MAKMKIKELHRDGGTQMRLKLNPDVIEEYRDAMLDGIEFPPVEVVYDGKNFWLWDGFTRVAAADSGGIKSIDVNVTKGTLRDAMFKAASANSLHGQRMTNDDKRNTVATMLQMAECASMSDRELAKLCAVSRGMVQQIRAGSVRLVSSAKNAKTTTPKVATVARGKPVDPPMTGEPAEDENFVDGEPAGERDDSHEQPGPTTITTPGVKPVGNLHELIAERDSLKDQVHEMSDLLAGLNDQIAAFELRLETKDPHRELMTALNESQARVRQLDERIRGLMSEKNEAIKSAKHWKKKATGK